MYKTDLSPISGEKPRSRDDDPKHDDGMISYPPLDSASGSKASISRPVAAVPQPALLTAVRRKAWSACLMSVRETEAWRGKVLDALLAVSFAHVPVLLLAGLALANPLTWQATAVALVSVSAAWVVRRMFSSWLAGAVLSSVLVVQATALVALFQGHPWQAEMNFYFVLVIAMAAAFFDPAILILSAIFVIVLHFVLNAVAPGFLFPGGGNIGHGILHGALALFETLGLFLIGSAVRLAVEFETRAATAIARLEETGRSLTTELATTSNRADRLDSALTTFRQETSRRLDRLHEASTELGETADDFSNAAARTTKQSISATNAAMDVNRQVREVAISCEDFRKVIAEIGAHAVRSTKIGAEAIGRAVATSATVDEFTMMSEKIDSILKLIAGIASHTNLLALNATIEAARAGEQGRGFAIVAGEVKSLALQTTAAVADINQVVGLIKGSTSRSVTAIASVAASIEDLNGVAAVIASAVDDRIRAATAMAEGIIVAARNVGEVTFAIGDIKAVADETGQGAGFLQNAAREIADETAAIRRDVNAFTTDLAAAQTG